jgi:NAD(P)-dependent dehydrogenase (short-subunit alcohol dehydrogenase family)
MTQVVLITGASSGIGRATAVEFARRGAKLVLGSRNEDTVQDLLLELGNDTVVFRRTDVTKAADAKALVALALERFGRLDVAVNNAALEARGTIEAFDEELYGRVFDTNVKGTFLGMQAQIPALRQSGGGAIVNVGATSGSRGTPGMSIYAASKHALEGLSRSAALELASEHIRVNVIAPGPVETPMLERVSGGHMEKFAQRVPMGRIGKPEELAQAIVWVASADASFVTGAVIPVNGGITAG